VQHSKGSKIHEPLKRRSGPAEEGEKILAKLHAEPGLEGGAPVVPAMMISATE
jgi:hypothetical protein